MKRYRHLTKGSAIVLSCFGSVTSQARFERLLNETQAQFLDCEVRLAISSRMVLKKLGQPQLKTLAQQLAELDREGYKRVVVASVYLFPTDEHLMATQIVGGFNQFSLTQMALTPAILQEVKSINTIIEALAARYPCQPHEFNLFVSHGAPDLSNPGYQAIHYTESLLQTLSPNNLTCSLEGAYPFALTVNALTAAIQNRCPAGVRPVIRLIPLLLVSGNHFEEDIREIAEQMDPEGDIVLATPIEGDRFCLLDLPEISPLLWQNIRNSLLKLGAPDLEVSHS